MLFYDNLASKEGFRNNVPMQKTLTALLVLACFATSAHSNPVHKVLQFQDSLLNKLSEKSQKAVEKEKVVQLELFYHKDDKKLPFQLELSRKGAPSDRDLAAMESSRIRSILMLAFRNREEIFDESVKSDPNQNQESNETAPQETSQAKKGVTSMELEWIQAPTLDYNKYHYSFLVKIIKGEKQYYYGKVLYLLKDGIVQFQVLDQVNDSQLELFQLFKDKVSAKEEFSYIHAKDINSYKQSWLLESAIVPIGSEPLSEEERLGGQSSLEKNRQTIGYFFLAFAMVFFLLINPGGKDSGKKDQ